MSLTFRRRWNRSRNSESPVLMGGMRGGEEAVDEALTATPIRCRVKVRREGCRAGPGKFVLARTDRNLTNVSWVTLYVVDTT
jgi:hypothetical protein